MVLSACAPAAASTLAQAMEVTNAMITMTGGSGMAEMGMDTSMAGYMQIKNNSKMDDRLIGVTCDFASAMLHETKMNGDVATMSEISSVDIPAGATVEFKTGGLHIMFMDMKQDLKPNDTVSLTLKFEKAGNLTVSAKVIEQ
jgi:copper(I)-binding protein